MELQQRDSLYKGLQDIFQDLTLKKFIRLLRIATNEQKTNELGDPAVAVPGQPDDSLPIVFERLQQKFERERQQLQTWEKELATRESVVSAREDVVQEKMMRMGIVKLCLNQCVEKINDVMDP